MTQKLTAFNQALTEVSASSAGGAPFLVAYGVTFIITGILAYILPEEPAALVALFQGGVALPAAFLLERRLRWGDMAPDNPLKSLSAQMAMSQALAIPALIIVYNLNPRAIPVVLAGVAGMHFLPYAWLHRTRLYVALAVAVSVGSFAIQLILGPPAFQVILLYVGIVYFVLTPFVYRHAAQVSRE